MSLYTRFTAHLNAVLDALEAEGALPSGINRKAVTVEPPRDVDMLRAAGLLEDSWAHPGRHPASSVTLSFGDALILAVVERLGVKVLTADRYWVQVAAEGVTSAVVVQL